MPHEPEHPRLPHHGAGGPVAAPDPALPALAVISLIEGMRERGLVADRDAAIGAALTAALTIAVDTQGVGNETAAITRAETIFRHLADEYRDGITQGRIRGRSRGGFERPAR